MTWYVNWFNSPFYHLLYKNRDEIEAENFLMNLIEKVPLEKTGPILDIACGKGRHSHFLHSQGFDVTGIDLSPENIKMAKEKSDDSLHFYEADMREFQLDQQYHYILNLFTSFGYFENADEDLNVFKNIKKHLKPEGLFLQDYLNANYIIENIVPEETKEIEGINFQINRYISDGYIIKKIQFMNEGETYEFQEKVKIYTPQDFEQLADQAQLKVTNLYGNYELQPFDEHLSPRLILQYQTQ